VSEITYRRGAAGFFCVGNHASYFDVSVPIRKQEYAELESTPPDARPDPLANVDGKPKAPKKKRKRRAEPK
jgi:hypothetical protein